MGTLSKRTRVDREVQLPSSNFQVPISKEVPNFQLPKSRPASTPQGWTLDIGSSLDVGDWWLGVVARVPLSPSQACFDRVHQPVEREADQADGEDAEDDVLVDQAVVFLPEEAA